MRVGTAATVVLLGVSVLGVSVLAAGCAAESGPASAPSSSPTSSISTLSPLPMPSMGPPPGEIVADLRQASRDAALNRFQVWIGNGLERDVNPTKILYVDGRFRAPIPGERLRLNPAGSERGYPLALPSRPNCGSNARSGKVTMEYAGRSVTIPVEDEADVVARYVKTRCFELDVARVASLSFADELHEGSLVLRIEPSGRPGGSLTIDEITGTPVLTAVGGASWRPDVRVRSTDRSQTVDLPVQPARCDGHAFLESGGATAFRVKLHLNGEPGELVVRMAPAGAAAAIGYAKDECGL